MNNLSWMIYFIGMVDSLGNFALWLAIPGTLGLIVVTIVWLVMNGVMIDELATKNHPDYGSATIARADAKLTSIQHGWKWWAVGRNVALTIWLVGWLLVLIVPSRQTLLLIAGSQMSETILESDAVQSVVNPGVDLLKEWIKTETDRLKGKKSEK